MKHHQSCLSLVRISLARELEAVKLRKVAGIAKSCGTGCRFSFENKGSTLLQDIGGALESWFKHSDDIAEERPCPSCPGMPQDYCLEFGSDEFRQIDVRSRKDQWKRPVLL